MCIRDRSGTDDYIGTVEFITSEVIEGKMINTGAAMITHSDNTVSYTHLDVYKRQGQGLSKSEQFILGYSTSKNGVPVEYREEGAVRTFGKYELATVSGFKRNTTYYFFLRYAETATHDKDVYKRQVDTLYNQSI